MSRKCFMCGKKTTRGSSITRRGMAKKKGGVGKKITGIAKRDFAPNLQHRKALVNGEVRRLLVCAKCIKAGKLTLPVRKPAVADK